MTLGRFEEARTLLRKAMPVARRALGDTDSSTLNIRWGYAQSLYLDANSTLDDVREAVTTLEETARTARRVLGGAHPDVAGIEQALQQARAVLRANEETQP